MRWEILLLLAVVLVCPLSMMWMMRSRRGSHDDQGSSGMRGMGGMCGMGGMGGPRARDHNQQHADGDPSVGAEPRRGAEGDVAADSSRTGRARAGDVGDGRLIR